jgi:hypothetical protein
MALTFTNPSTENGTTSNSLSILSPCQAYIRFRVNRSLANCANVHWALRIGQWVQSTFSEPATFPTAAYFEYSTSSIVPSTWHSMTWVGTNNAQPGAAQVLFIADGGSHTWVHVRYRYLAPFDIGDLYRNTTYANGERLLKDHVQHTNVLSNAYNADVYSQERQLRMVVFGNDTVLNESAKLARNIAQRLRFYNREPLNQAPRYLQEIGVVIERGGLPVTHLSTQTPTTVRLQVQALPDLMACPSWLAQTNVYAFLLRTDRPDNALPFWQSYDIQYIDVESMTTPLAPEYSIGNNGVWTGPSSGIAPTGPTNYQCFLTLNPALLVAGARYRIVQLWRIEGNCLPVEQFPAGLPAHEFAFISPEWTATTDISCQIPANSLPQLRYLALENYTSAYIGTVNVAALEPLTSRLEIDFSAYEADPTRNAVADALHTVIVEILEEGTNNVEHIFIDAHALGLGGGRFRGTAAFTDLGYSQNIYRHAFRFMPQQDPTTSNRYSRNSSGITIAGQTNNDWRGRRLTVRTTFRLRHNSFQDELVVEQRFTVMLDSPLLAIGYQQTGGGNLLVDFVCAGSMTAISACATHRDETNHPVNTPLTNAFMAQLVRKGGNQSLLENAIRYPMNIHNGISPSTGTTLANPELQYQAGSETACVPLAGAGWRQTRPDSNFRALRIGFGHALDLSPSRNGQFFGEHVRFPHLSAYEWGCEGRSFECWLLLKAYPAAGTVSWIWHKQRTAAGLNMDVPAMGWGILPSGAMMGFWRTNSSPLWEMAAQHPTLIPLNQWVHLVWVKPANSHLPNQQQLYVNGGAATPIAIAGTLNSQQCHMTRRQDTSGAFVAGAINDGDLIIGARYGCNSLHPDYFGSSWLTTAALMAALTVYDFALTPAEVEKQFQKGRGGVPIRPLDCSLIARFNAASGDRLPELSRHRNVGILPVFADYDVPNAAASCTPTTPRSFGYVSGRIANGGGAWILS